MMNRRMSIALIAFAGMLGGSGLMYLKEKRAQNAIPAVALAAPVATDAAEAGMRQAPALSVAAPPAPAVSPAPAPAVVLAPAGAIVQAPGKSPILLEGGEVEPAMAVGALSYTARSGDTLSELAVALLGKDSKANRDIVVSANPSLQANPDHVDIGRVYDTSAPAVVVAVAPAPAPAESPARPTRQADVISPKAEVAPVEAVEPKPELKYTAKPGDTVNNLAGALLGGETKTNRDAIVNANASLQMNADRVVAGRTYRIPAPDGLSAATQPIASATARPATRPDADEIIQAGAPRTLRYTAKNGDTVTSLAVALLGSDTKANRDSIINTNPSLKTNPDRVVVGQTYWIPAPVAEVQLTR
jgi:LysM repeat protein